MIVGVLFVFLVLWAVQLYLFSAVLRRREENELRLWGIVDELRGDCRSLTESLCRAQGKPFINPPVPKSMREPSEGWFDGKVEIKVVPPK